MCEDCIKVVKEYREKNNNMVQDRVSKGLPLKNKKGIMGTIGHIYFGLPCIHQISNKK
jgi:hypothetical protein